MELSLLAVCVCSFVGVFIILVFLAFIMHVIMNVFPARTTTVGSTEPNDGEMIAAVASAYARRFPGTRIRKIEETHTIKN